MPRASLVEKRARALCVELTRVTANTPMEYWMVRLIARLVATDYKTADAAIAHAVAQGWLLTEGEPPQSICLADDNRWRQFATVWPRRLTSSAMSSETETLALHLVRALHDATDDLPQQWRMLEELDATTMDAIEFAVARGWVVVQAGHSICLTDA